MEVRLTVTDLDRSGLFYQGLLGLPLMSHATRDGVPTQRTYAAGLGRLVLVTLAEAARLGGEAAGPGGAMVVLPMEGLLEHEARLREAGADVRVGRRLVEATRWEAVVADPDGHLIALAEDVEAITDPVWV